jgi:hypothetical protein
VKLNSARWTAPGRVRADVVRAGLCQRQAGLRQRHRWVQRVSHAPVFSGQREPVREPDLHRRRWGDREWWRTNRHGRLHGLRRRPVVGGRRERVLPQAVSGGRGVLELGLGDSDGVCALCSAGQFSAGGSTACAPMSCPAGSASSKSSSVNATDGCSACAPGTFSPGAGASCGAMACPPGRGMTSVTGGAVNATHGCTVCALGRFRSVPP